MRAHRTTRFLPAGLVTLALAIGGLGVGGLGGSAAHAVPASPAAADHRVGDTLFPTSGNPGYQVRRYAVVMDYAPTTNAMVATTTITAHAQTRLATFHLDLLGMTVHAITVGGAKATWTRSGHELVVRPAHAVPRGKFDVVVHYSGKPQEYTDADGSTEGWVRTADGAIALDEPIGAMTWLPSNNTPGDKAHFTYRVTVPTGYQVVANGVPAGTTVSGNHTTYAWNAPDRMSTYLATIGIGHYTVTHSTTTSVTGRTIPIWNYVDPTTKPATSTPDVAAVIAFEERYFGPYPFASAGMIIDDADVGYALETQTRPFYPEGIDTTTLVHEMAHQWYGDSLTLRDWHDIWLAEGFATYAEWLWAGAHGGDTPAQHFATLYARPASDGLWRPAPRTFTDSADLFGEPVYSRGAMTLQALRMKIGGHDFLALLKAWAAAHRQGTVHNAQFVRLAEKMSGRDLGHFFHVWLDEPGKPAGY